MINDIIYMLNFYNYNFVDEFKLFIDNQVVNKKNI